MTPTPNPPPAAPLTAERHLPGAPFSEIRERALREALWSRIQLREARWEFALQDIADFFATIDADRAETAALRDRLARAEARCAALTEALLIVEWEYNDMATSPGMAYYCPFCTAYSGSDKHNPKKHTADCIIRTLIPTDGAARAGDAADDGGESNGD